MRQWSEEQRSGTLEMLLTLPVSNVQLVLGKFLAVDGAGRLVAGADPLPAHHRLAARHLDWGPVVGGYLAALLLAGCLHRHRPFHLLPHRQPDRGADPDRPGLRPVLPGRLAGVTDFARRPRAGDLLRALGAGSRFESIERGVIDLRDLVYYLSLAGIFLVFNVLSLDRKRWSRAPRTRPTAARSP